MNSSEENESASVDEREKATFGNALLRARESKGYSIVEVAKATHLGEDIIDAIEQSDMKRLPPPMFVQGYLRTYARYLELPEQEIVDDFNRAVPYKRETQLHPRTTLPAQAGMHSPWIRGISIFLVFLVIFALIYGAYGYYARTAKTIGLEKTNALAFSSSEQDAGASASGQSTAIPENGAPLATAQNNNEKTEPEKAPATLVGHAKTGAATASKSSAVTPASGAVSTATVDKPAATAADKSSTNVDAGTDVLDLKAADDSWVEIADATGRRLYHDLMRKGQSLHLQGKAPFSVFLGNALVIDLRINGAKVKMDGRIRNNKVARFTVSTSESGVVLH